MMKLWRETFHDTEEYVTLLFDNYFHADNIACLTEGDKLKAALMAIPYTFKSKYGEIPAVYLCGLATRPEYRRLGLMTRLMDEILDRSKKGGAALAFLIPANDGLRRYYRDRGWSDAIYRVTEHYTELHNFLSEEEKREMDEKYNFTRIEYLKTNDPSLENIKFSNLVEKYIQSKESEKTYLSLVHDDRMMKVTMQENALSNGQVWVARNKADKICGVLFVVPDESGSGLDVRYLVCDDSRTENMLLQTLHENNVDHPISLRRFPEECRRKALWEPLYGASLPEVNSITGFGEAERVYDPVKQAATYGMAKILDLNTIIKYLNAAHEPGKDEKYPIIEDVAALRKMLPNLKDEQIQALILRHPHENDKMGELFGLRRLPLNMALLLD